LLSCLLLGLEPSDYIIIHHLKMPQKLFLAIYGNNPLLRSNVSLLRLEF
jgi:hypothetical protein